MKVKFREIANFVAGQSPKSEYYSESEGVPFLQGNRTFGIFYPTIDTYTTKTTKIANKGDILMSVRAPVGDLNFAPIDLCIGRGLASITAKDGDNAFLFYALKYNINNLLKQSNGTTYDSVTGDIVKDMDMIIPDDKNVCKKISKLLYAIDLKIDNNKQIISELESMAKTIYDYWFLQYEFPNEEGKPYKSSGGKMVYNEELKRDIPYEWKTGNLYDIADFINGIACQKFRPKKEEKTLPVIKIKEMHNGITEDTEIVREDIPIDNIIEAGDILFSWSATLEVMKWYGIKGALNQHIFKVIPKKYGLNYTYMQLSQYIINFVLMAQARKTTMGHITTDHIKQSKIVLPTLKITDKFEKETNSIFNKILQCQKENLELTKLRDELLPLLMNGQVGFKE